MKRFLLIALCLISWECLFAQDVVLLKDGTKIQSKVLEIGESSIKYKKWENQNGPTYTLLISSINSITYMNGTKDYFTPYGTDANNALTESIDNAGKTLSNSVNNSGRNISKSVGNIAHQQDLYTKARALDACGWIFGGACFVGSFLWGINSDSPVGPILVGGLGTTAIVALFMVPASNLRAEAYHLASNSMFKYEVNDSVAVELYQFNYQPTRQSCYGIGVQLNF